MSGIWVINPIKVVIIRIFNNYVIACSVDIAGYILIKFRFIILQEKFLVAYNILKLGKGIHLIIEIDKINQK